MTYVPVPIDEYLAPIRADISKAKEDIDNLTRAIQSRVDIIARAEEKINSLKPIELMEEN